MSHRDEGWELLSTVRSDDPAYVLELLSPVGAPFTVRVPFMFQPTYRAGDTEVPELEIRFYRNYRNRD